jgi:membrane fusion protein (multidrug efflux system)
VLFGLLIVSLAGGVPYGTKLRLYYRSHESTDDAYVVGDIVPVSARVNGTAASVHVDGHQRVETGQLLTQLDPRDF